MCRPISVLQNQPAPASQKVMAGDNEKGKKVGIAQEPKSSPEAGEGSVD